MYKNIKKYEIRFTDSDAFDILKPSSLLSYLEESACLSADELGFGYDAISKKNLGFIIVNYYIELYRPLKLGETVEIHTWPVKPRHTIFFRDFEFYINGDKVGVATTRWCMVNLPDFTVAPVSAFFNEEDFSDYNTERSVIFGGWKIPTVGCGAPVYSKKITFSDYDHYFHVNNTKYADLMLDVFSVEELRGKTIKKLQISYAKQCKIDEILDLYKTKADGYYIIEGRVGDEVRVQFKVEFNGI